ncbi:MAG TPA: membrane protein insertion efficiency factor YidD [Pirellulales bacterium]|nr:membrane protein insertion efficiency factor YidD [Pirellulales bacterium]
MNRIRRTTRWLWLILIRLPGRLLIGLVRVYQWTLSPLIGRQCRFTPTCSNYFIGAVQKYGAVRGTLRGVWRICRCHPFHPGGHDPP